MTDLETVLTPIRERDEGNDHSYPSWETAWSDRHTLLRLSKWIGHQPHCTIEGHCCCGFDDELRAIGEE